MGQGEAAASRLLRCCAREDPFDISAWAGLAGCPAEGHQADADIREVGFTRMAGLTSHGRLQGSVTSGARDLACAQPQTTSLGLQKLASGPTNTNNKQLANKQQLENNVGSWHSDAAATGHQRSGSGVLGAEMWRLLRRLLFRPLLPPRSALPLTRCAWRTGHRALLRRGCGAIRPEHRSDPSTWALC